MCYLWVSCLNNWSSHSDDSGISTKMMNTISEAVCAISLCASKTIEERRNCHNVLSPKFLEFYIYLFWETMLSAKFILKEILLNQLGNNSQSH